MKEVYIPTASTHLIEDKDLLPKLEFYKNYSFFKFEDFNRLKILSDKYSQTMKTLGLNFDRMSYKELKTYFDCISRFENLRELKLELIFDGMAEPIDDCLSLIGQKLCKLLKLDLDIINRHSVPISDRFFDGFTQFKAIKILKIEFPYNTRVLSGSLEFFKHCKQLKHLDIVYEELSEDFFTNIREFVPKLQFLKISTKKEYSDSFIDLFLPMKDIQRIELRDNNECFPKTWHFRKCLTEIMLSPNGKHVIRVNDYCGKIDLNYCQDNYH